MTPPIMAIFHTVIQKQPTQSTKMVGGLMRPPYELKNSL